MQKQPAFILFATLFLVMAGFGIILPLLPFFSQNLGATPLQIGLLMASYSLMQFIFSPMWGSLSDKFGRKPIILIGLAGFAISFAMFGFATNLTMLFASRIAGGILSSACLPAAMAYILIIFSRELFSFMFFVILATMGNAFCRPSLASIISKETEFEEGVTMGTMQSMDSLGRVIGPIFGGGAINLVFLIVFLII